LQTEVREIPELTEEPIHENRKRKRGNCKRERKKDKRKMVMCKRRKITAKKE
jgi:hypothetical protein